MAADDHGPIHQPGMFNIEAYRLGRWHGGMNRSARNEAIAVATAWHDDDGLRYRVFGLDGQVIFDTKFPDVSASDFQSRVAPWMQECFGAAIANDVRERGDRLLEEVLELLQSHGYEPARVATLRDYVFGRPIGEPQQEVGGVMVTLAAYCLATGIDMHKAGDTELERISAPEVVERIRMKQASKRGLHTPLPVPPTAPSEQVGANVEAELDFEPDEHHTIADMANVGYSLMKAIKSNCPDFCWGESPAEIVVDLINQRDEAAGIVPGASEAAASVAVPRWFVEKLAQDVGDIGMPKMEASLRGLLAAAPVAPEREVGHG